MMITDLKGYGRFLRYSGNCVSSDGIFPWAADMIFVECIFVVSVGMRHILVQLVSAAAWTVGIAPVQIWYHYSPLYWVLVPVQY